MAMKHNDNRGYSESDDRAEAYITQSIELEIPKEKYPTESDDYARYMTIQHKRAEYNNMISPSNAKK